MRTTTKVRTTTTTTLRCASDVLFSKVGRAGSGTPSQDGGVSGGSGSGDTAVGGVHELLKVVPPALAQLLSFDHLRYDFMWKERRLGVSKCMSCQGVVIGEVLIRCTVVRYGRLLYGTEL